jgi:hypothetical protein
MARSDELDGLTDGSVGGMEGAFHFNATPTRTSKSRGGDRDVLNSNQRTVPCPLDISKSIRLSFLIAGPNKKEFDPVRSSTLSTIQSSIITALQS